MSVSEYERISRSARKYYITFNLLNIPLFVDKKINTSSPRDSQTVTP